MENEEQQEEQVDKKVFEAPARQFILTQLAEGTDIKDIALTLEVDESDIIDFMREVATMIVNKDISAVDQSKKFILSYTLSEDGTVSCGIQWPHPSKIPDYIDAIPRLLYILHKGLLKDETASMFLSFAEEYKAHTLVNTILSTWGDIEKETTKSRPLVGPDEVFSQ